MRVDLVPVVFIWKVVKLMNPVCCVWTLMIVHCSICKTLNMSAIALRRRAYNDAKIAGYVFRKGVRLTFPPISSPFSVPPLRSETTAQYFGALPSRERDNMLDQDDAEYNRLTRESVVVFEGIRSTPNPIPSPAKGTQTPVSAKNIGRVEIHNYLFFYFFTEETETCKDTGFK